MNLKEILNPRIFEIPDYDQAHVTKCWQDPVIRRQMSNESNYAPIEAVQKAICEAAKDANYYAEDPSYALSLREKLAAYASVKAENVALGNGSIEVLDLIFQIFMADPGVDEAILLQPDYSAYVPRMTYFGWKIKFANLSEGLDKAADQVLESISDKTKFVLLSRPNNPMGSVMPEEEIRRMLETGKIIIVDEAYIEISDEGTSVSDWINKYENLIVLRTFSKGFCLAGIRLGYMLADSEIVRLVNRSRHIFNVNLAAMRAGEAAMDHLAEYRKVFKKMANTRDWLVDELSKIKGFMPIPSQANFVMVDVKGSGKTATECVNFLLEKNFFVRSFAKKAGLEPDTHFRISVGLPNDMEELIEDLKAFI
ncbi:MAG: aminotransferase class I/II-fold pyridoxal phosphate-dependent enzyme [Pelolinea sp.]|nr:aminotransferase class I/II-fold pyridoxal phosphate-dependent enzyme [Pelolinea sp.]